MHFCKAHVLLYTDSNYFNYVVKIIQHFCQILLFLNLISYSKLYYYIFLIKNYINISRTKNYYYFSYKKLLLFLVQNYIIISHLKCVSNAIQNGGTAYCPHFQIVPISSLVPIYQNHSSKKLSPFTRF